jgi:hypothetical protein
MPPPRDTARRQQLFPPMTISASLTFLPWIRSPSRCAFTLPGNLVSRNLRGQGTRPSRAAGCREIEFDDGVLRLSNMEVTAPRKTPYGVHCPSQWTIWTPFPPRHCVVGGGFAYCQISHRLEHSALGPRFAPGQWHLAVNAVSSVSRPWLSVSGSTKKQLALCLIGPLVFRSTIHGPQTVSLGVSGRRPISRRLIPMLQSEGAHFTARLIPGCDLHSKPRSSQERASLALPSSEVCNIAAGYIRKTCLRQERGWRRRQRSLVGDIRGL